MDIMIDPPSGWMFGFPKRLKLSEKEAEEFNMREWLIRNNYPEAMIDELGDMFYIRSWPVQ